MPGLPWGTWDLSSLLQHAGSFFQLQHEESLFFFSYDMRDLVPWPGIEPRPPALGVQSLSHWPPGKSPGPVLCLQPASLNSQVPCKSCMPNMSVKVPQGADPAGIWAPHCWPGWDPGGPWDRVVPWSLSVITKICIHSVHSRDPWPHAAVEPLERGQCDQESGFEVCFLLTEASGAPRGSGTNRIGWLRSRSSQFVDLQTETKEKGPVLDHSDPSSRGLFCRVKAWGL